MAAAQPARPTRVRAVADRWHPPSSKRKRAVLSRLVNIGPNEALRLNQVLFQLCQCSGQACAHNMPPARASDLCKLGGSTIPSGPRSTEGAGRRVALHNPEYTVVSSLPQASARSTLQSKPQLHSARCSDVDDGPRRRCNGVTRGRPLRALVVQHV